MTFEITEDHIKLIRNLDVSLNYWGHKYTSPYIDQKRPYGNSNIPGDIGKILGVKEEGMKPCPFGEEPYEVYTDEQEEMLLGIHAELIHVIDIMFKTGSYELGSYSKTKYGWMKSSRC